MADETPPRDFRSPNPSRLPRITGMVFSTALAIAALFVVFAVIVTIGNKLRFREKPTAAASWSPLENGPPLTFAAPTPQASATPAPIAKPSPTVKLSRTLGDYKGPSGTVFGRGAVKPVPTPTVEATAGNSD